MKKALVFGASGGIGSCLCQLLVAAGHQVVPITHDQIDLTSVDSSRLISYTIDQHQPNWIFNCAGVLGNNESSYHSIFDVNLGSNWAIIQHYMHQPTTVQIVMLGSSAYQSGRKHYMLYAASKAALHNLWQGATEYFQDTAVNLGLIHTARVRTPMIQIQPNQQYLNPVDVAQAMIDLCKDMNQSQMIKMEITQ